MLALARLDQIIGLEATYHGLREIDMSTKMKFNRRDVAVLESRLCHQEKGSFPLFLKIKTEIYIKRLICKSMTGKDFRGILVVTLKDYKYDYCRCYLNEKCPLPKNPENLIIRKPKWRGCFL